MATASTVIIASVAAMAALMLQLLLVPGGGMIKNQENDKVRLHQGELGQCPKSALEKAAHPNMQTVLASFGMVDANLLG